MTLQEGVELLQRAILVLNRNDKDLKSHRREGVGRRSLSFALLGPDENSGKAEAQVVVPVR